MARALKLAWNALAWLGAIMALATFSPLPYWYATALAGEWNEGRGGVLLVPGADYESAEMMGLGSYRRAIYAKLYWEKGDCRGIVLLGRGVAPLMRDWLVSQGVPAEAVRVDDTSTSTRENALEAAKILKAKIGREREGALVLLTSDFHIFRSERVFRKAGLAVTSYPIPDARKRWQHWPMRWAVALDLAGESAKIAWYRMKGWM
jgi:uncharacterized SAM-binding protein YcdF (DUF218 family)